MRAFSALAWTIIGLMLTVEPALTEVPRLLDYGRSFPMSSDTSRGLVMVAIVALVGLAALAVAWLEFAGRRSWRAARVFSASLLFALVLPTLAFGRARDLPYFAGNATLFLYGPAFFFVAGIPAFVAAWALASVTQKADDERARGLSA